MLFFFRRQRCWYVVTSTLLILAAMPMSGQNTLSLQIAAKAIHIDHKVIIRWAPANHETWRWGNTHGYDLVRYTVVQNGDTLTATKYAESRQEIATEIKPLPESAWETLADSNDLAGVAAGSIYGDSLELLPPAGPGLLNVYNKNQEYENRFSFSLFAADQDFNVAQMMGLAYLDDEVQESSQYAYFIYPHDQDSLMQVKEGFAFVRTDSSFTLPAPTGLKGFAGDSSASLQWQRNDLAYTSFILERSTDGIHFIQINDQPMIAAATEGANNRISFVDSLYANNIAFIYRVRGRSPFGLLSPPSDTVHVTGRPGPILALLSMDEIEELQEGALTVTWSFPTPMEGKIQGFDVYRSPGSEGPFVKITGNSLSNSTRTFVDTNPASVNYYQVRTADINGYELSSYPRLGQPKDDTPPSAPASVWGQANASGVVTLQWNRSPEADVMGYRIFMSNTSAGDFAQVTSVWLNDTTFTYQLNLNTLTELVYFGVKALDYHHNQSPMSVPVQIVRPDIVPPSPPLITTVSPTAQGIAFEWLESSSPDVFKHEFQRKVAGLPGWTVLAEFDKQHPLSGFLDTTASRKRWYQYRLVAEDESGNRGGSRIVKAKPINDGLRDAIANLSGQLVSNSGTAASFVRLEWDYPRDIDLIGFQIYRGYDSTSMFSYRFFPFPLPASADYADMAIAPNGNLMHCRFKDFDVAFTDDAISSYSYFYNSSLDQNLAVPPPQGAPAPGSVQSYTVPNPVPSQPNMLKYWVLAKFADGSYSPLAGPVLITL